MRRGSPANLDALPEALAGGFVAAEAAYRDGSVSAPEVAAAYIAERVRLASPGRWRQAERRPSPEPIPASPWLSLFATRELHRVPRAVPDALLAWSRGERAVDLLFDVPTPRDVLARQARGRRCLSLLADGVPTTPHEDALAFAVHDLCHLEKFAHSEHHAGQVGFFALVHHAMADARWAALEAPFDALWHDGRDYVIADMNGSPAFLFVALRSKLKLAVRGAVARARGDAVASNGPLDGTEEAALDDAFAALFDLLDLQGPVRDAALAFSSRSAGAEAAACLLEHFHARGLAVLAGTDGCAPEGDLGGG